MDKQDERDLITEGGHSCVPRRKAGPPIITEKGWKSAQRAQGRQLGILCFLRSFVAIFHNSLLSLWSLCPLWLIPHAGSLHTD